jgi:glycosyltransferase involved in cell wall biosynthesis
MPTLSILTPSFNYAWCMEDALRSVARAAEAVPQGWRVEHVVVDDASSDESPQILERWKPSIVLERSVQNRGQSSTLNRCLDLASGEWVGWLNADDFFLPGSFREVCDALDDDIDVLYGEVALLNGSAEFTRLMTQHPFSLWTLRWWGTYLSVGAVFLRRGLLSELRWREDLSLLLDWDLWLRAAEAGGRFRFLPRPLAAVRWHPGQESRQDRPERLSEKAQVRREHGLPSKPWMWRAAQRVAALSHGARKLASGGYKRERQAAALRGRPMRWFDDHEARSSVETLYERVYGSNPGQALPTAGA